MKIIESGSAQTTTLSDIKSGEVFLFEGIYYIKTTGYVGQSGCTGVVDLETGYGVEIPLDYEVTPVEAELHIK